MNENDTAICPACNGSSFNARDADCGFCGGCGGVPMEAAERWYAEERRWNAVADRLIDHARNRAARPSPTAS